MSDDRERLVSLLLDFATLVNPAADDKARVALHDKAREVVDQIERVAYAEATEAIDSAVNPTALI